MHYLALALGVVFNALANVLIKTAMDGREQFHAASLLEYRAGLHLPLLAGVLCFAIALGGYAYSLTRVDLTVGYPIMTGAGLALIAVYSAAMFDERLDVYRIMGTLAIFVGILLLIRSQPSAL